MSNKIFHKVPVQIQNRSGFDLSHKNNYTMQVGTLYPILVDQLIPGDNVSLSQITEVQLPPMATDFYGRVQMKMEVFFCPNRLCYGGFQSFMTFRLDTNNPNTRSHYIPQIRIPLGEAGPGSLADMLGFKNKRSATPSVGFTIKNSLPFIAYHRIWNDWYRDSLIQKPCFIEPDPTNDQTMAAYIPYTRFIGDSPTVLSSYLSDDTYLYRLRQRCWPKDYFTNAKLNPQFDQPSTLAFRVENNTGSFTIASLRASNTLQQWRERQNLAGSRYIEQIKSNYGVTPSDAVLDRPVYLGSHSFDIYNKSVYQSNSTEQESNNPFKTIGSKYSSPLGVDDSGLVDNFTANEFGFLFVIASIVPESLYSSGTRKYLDYSTYTDFANPILSAIGDQEIKKSELLNVHPLESDDTFGYTQRYSEYKFMLDEVHGHLQDGENLSSFVLQRSFEGDVELSSSFIEIPTTYLDQVTAVSSTMSNYGAWGSTYFNYKKSSVMPAYSIPTLGDPKDTHTEVIDNGGKRL